MQARRGNEIDRHFGKIPGGLIPGFGSQKYYGMKTRTPYLLLKKPCGERPNAAVALSEFFRL